MPCFVRRYGYNGDLQNLNADGREDSRPLRCSFRIRVPCFGTRISFFVTQMFQQVRCCATSCAGIDSWILDRVSAADGAPLAAVVEQSAAAGFTELLHRHSRRLVPEIVVVHDHLQVVVAKPLNRRVHGNALVGALTHEEPPEVVQCQLLRRDSGGSRDLL